MPRLALLKMDKLFRQMLAKCCIKDDGESSLELKNAILCCVTTRELHLDLRDGPGEKEEEAGTDDRGKPSSDILQLRGEGRAAEQPGDSFADTAGAGKEEEGESPAGENLPQ